MPFFDVTREAVFSPDKKYRYSLIREWQDNLPRLYVIMLNPSIGDDKKDDPTIRNVMVFAEQTQYGSIEIGNLHALVSSDPQMLLRVNDPIGPDNKVTLFRIVDQAKSETSSILCAWGATKFIAKNIDLDVIQYARAKHVHLLCLGKTKSGAPRHPLYVPYSQSFLEF